MCRWFVPLTHIILVATPTVRLTEKCMFVTLQFRLTSRMYSPVYSIIILNSEDIAHACCTSQFVVVCIGQRWSPQMVNKPLVARRVNHSSCICAEGNESMVEVMPL